MPGNKPTNQEYRTRLAFQVNTLKIHYYNVANLWKLFHRGLQNATLLVDLERYKIDGLDESV